MPSDQTMRHKIELQSLINLQWRTRPRCISGGSFCIQGVNRNSKMEDHNRVKTVRRYLTKVTNFRYTFNAQTIFTEVVSSQNCKM